MRRLTLSFVNLAEFSRLNASLFLKSYVLYCSLYDPAFLSRRHQYFNEILEGITKNPYDLLLDNLLKCGHLGALREMVVGPSRVQYGPEDMRLLLHNILSALADRMQDVLLSAYVITPEDPLHITIRAMQVWLEVNEIPIYIHTQMTLTELQRSLSTRYSHYPALVPSCALTEEEAIIMVRAQERPNPRGNRRHQPCHNECEPGSSALAPPKGSAPLLWIMHESHILTSLLELSHYPRFLERVRGMKLLTLGDPEGTAYSLLYHTWPFESGFPY